MTDKNDDGGLAYPHKFTVRSDSGDAVVSEPGMTWLDRCAIAAMQGLVIAGRQHAADTAETAYRYAAAMLTEKRRRERG